MLEEEEGEEESQNNNHENNDDNLAPPAKRIRALNTLDIDDDETNIANNLRTFPSRPLLQINQEGDGDRGTNDGHSDQGDADRDADLGTTFGNNNPEFEGEEEFGDNGVCGSSFT